MANKKQTNEPGCDDWILRMWGTNPQVATAEMIRITPAEFERIMRSAYNAGYKTADGQKSFFERIMGK